MEYSLGDPKYHFVYRHDNNDFNIMRATLYEGNRRMDDVRVSEHPLGIPEKSHTDVINHFEARLQMGLIS